ncbi:hypothetical protein ACFQU7_04925 [Pseudoroseomonas wenyumeiae]
MPRLIVAESAGASPLLDALQGRPGPAAPSLLAWQELERSAFAFLETADALAGMLAVAADTSSRAALGLDAASRILLLNCSPVPSEGTAG